MKSRILGCILILFGLGCGETPSRRPVSISTPSETSGNNTGVQTEIPNPNNRTVVTDEAALPPGVSYEIIKQDVIPNVKRSVDVRLKRRVSEDVLIKIATAIKSSAPNTYANTFIGYYLPYHKPNDIYWATTHFKPELEIRILGMKANDETKLKENAKDGDRIEIGKWLDESSFPKRVTIYRKNGTAFMEEAYADGSGNTTELRSKSVSRGVRFDKDKNSVGDYWILDASGNLQIHDNEGLIYTCRKLDGG